MTVRSGKKSRQCVFLLAENLQNVMPLFKKPTFLQSGVERFRTQLESALGRTCTLYRHPSQSSKLPKVFVLIFADFPGKGYLTAYSYGLSANTDSSGSAGRELVIQVKSTEENWGHILGFLISHLREDCPFEPGQVIRFGQQIAPDSAMQHFVVHEASSMVGPTSYPLTKRFHVGLVQLSPIYDTEINRIAERGSLPFLSEIESVKEQVNRPAVAR